MAVSIEIIGLIQCFAFKIDVDIYQETTIVPHQIYFILHRTKNNQYTKQITDDDDYDNGANSNFGEAGSDNANGIGKEVRYAPQQAQLQRAHSR